MAAKREHLKQYFVAIIPPPPAYDEMQALKAYFREQYQSKAALNSPPHITLHMPFFWAEHKETKLIAKLHEFTNQWHPMKICLDNFSSFPPRVIFAAVTPSDVLDSFQKSLHRYFKRELNIFNANYKERPYHPHLTLAFRDLKKSAYQEAWQEFSGREYKSEFIADRIALLKHNGRTWDVFQEFLLEHTYSAESSQKLETTEG